MPCDLLVSFSLSVLLEPLGIVTKVEKEGEEEEEKEEGEEGRKKGEEEEEGKERMSYPRDPMLEDESLQYRVQGTFSQHRYSSSYLHCYKALLVILNSSVKLTGFQILSAADSKRTVNSNSLKAIFLPPHRQTEKMRKAICMHTKWSSVTAEEIMIM
jgi:hypothetical protein